MKILPLEGETLSREDFTKKSSFTSIALEYLKKFNQASDHAMLLQQPWQVFCNDLVLKVEYDRFFISTCLNGESL